MTDRSSVAARPSARIELTTTTEHGSVLSPPRHRVHRRAIVLWTLRAVSDGLWFLLPLGIAHLTIPVIRPWTGPLWLLIVALTLITALVAPTWRYLVHRWETSGSVVYTLTGWVTREWRIIPISRVQSVDVIAGPLEQLLGLATVRVRTAAKTGDIRIDGIADDLAAVTAESLSRIAQLTEGDAT